MIRKTSEQLLALIDHYKISGLSQTEFAKQQSIDPSYFSLRKGQLLAWQKDDNHGFVELTTNGHLFLPTDGAVYLRVRSCGVRHLRYSLKVNFRD